MIFKWLQVYGDKYIYGDTRMIRTIASYIATAWKSPQFWQFCQSPYTMTFEAYDNVAPTHARTLFWEASHSGTQFWNAFLNRFMFGTYYCSVTLFFKAVLTRYVLKHLKLLLTDKFLLALTFSDIFNIFVIFDIMEIYWHFFVFLFFLIFIFFPVFAFFCYLLNY